MSLEGLLNHLIHNAIDRASSTDRGERISELLDHAVWSLSSDSAISEFPFALLNKFPMKASAYTSKFIFKQPQAFYTLSEETRRCLLEGNILSFRRTVAPLLPELFVELADLCVCQSIFDDLKINNFSGLSTFKKITKNVAVSKILQDDLIDLLNEIEILDIIPRSIVSKSVLLFLRGEKSNTGGIQNEFLRSFFSITDHIEQVNNTEKRKMVHQIFLRFTAKFPEILRNSLNRGKIQLQTRSAQSLQEDIHILSLISLCLQDEQLRYALLHILSYQISILSTSLRQLYADKMNPLQQQQLIDQVSEMDNKSHQESGSSRNKEKIEFSSNPLVSSAISAVILRAQQDTFIQEIILLLILPNERNRLRLIDKQLSFISHQEADVQKNINKDQNEQQQRQQQFNDIQSSCIIDLVELYPICKFAIPFLVYIAGIEIKGDNEQNINTDDIFLSDNLNNVSSYSSSSSSNSPSLSLLLDQIPSSLSPIDSITFIDSCFLSQQICLTFFLITLESVLKQSQLQQHQNQQAHSSIVTPPASPSSSSSYFIQRHINQQQNHIQQTNTSYSQSSSYMNSLSLLFSSLSILYQLCIRYASQHLFFFTSIISLVKNTIFQYNTTQQQQKEQQEQYLQLMKKKRITNVNDQKKFMSPSSQSSSQSSSSSSQSSQSQFNQSPSHSISPTPVPFSPNQILSSTPIKRSQSPSSSQSQQQPYNYIHNSLSPSSSVYSHILPSSADKYAQNKIQANFGQFQQEDYNNIIIGWKQTEIGQIFNMIRSKILLPLVLGQKYNTNGKEENNLEFTNKDQNQKVNLEKQQSDKKIRKGQLSAFHAILVFDYLTQQQIDQENSEDEDEEQQNELKEEFKDIEQEQQQEEIQYKISMIKHKQIKRPRKQIQIIQDNEIFSQLNQERIDIKQIFRKKLIEKLRSNLKKIKEIQNEDEESEQKQNLKEKIKIKIKKSKKPQISIKEVKEEDLKEEFEDISALFGVSDDDEQDNSHLQQQIENELNNESNQKQNEIEDQIYQEINKVKRKREDNYIMDEYDISLQGILDYDNIDNIQKDNEQKVVIGKKRMRLDDDDEEEDDEDKIQKDSLKNNEMNKDIIDQKNKYEKIIQEQNKDNKMKNKSEQSYNEVINEQIFQNNFNDDKKKINQIKTQNIQNLNQIIQQPQILPQFLQLSIKEEVDILSMILSSPPSAAHLLRNTDRNQNKENNTNKERGIQFEKETDQSNEREKKMIKDQYDEQKIVDEKDNENEYDLRDEFITESKIEKVNEDQLKRFLIMSTEELKDLIAYLLNERKKDTIK